MGSEQLLSGSPGHSEPHDDRYALRSALRHVTSLKRVRLCGLPLGSSVAIRERGGVHYYDGIQTCGSGWVCPVCAAKMRFQRGKEIKHVLEVANNKGETALFVTRTIPHTLEDSLKKTLNTLAEGRRYVSNQPLIKRIRRESGYIGSIASKQITYGKAGWHPHTHDIEMFEQPISPKNYAGLRSAYYDYLNYFYERRGFSALSQEFGIHIQEVSPGGEALARYMVQALGRTALQTYNHPMLHHARLGEDGAESFTPLDIVREHLRTGDRQALSLWHEYEAATYGKSSIRFTDGLRERLLPRETAEADGELNTLPADTETIQFTAPFYRKLARIPGLERAVLGALDTGGMPALNELLAAHQLGEEGHQQLLLDL